MVLEAWDESSEVGFDRQLWAELTTLRFLDDAWPQRGDPDGRLTFVATGDEV